MKINQKIQLRSLPIRVPMKLGFKKFVIMGNVTGLVEGMNQGDTYLVNDHMSWTGLSPLHGPNVESYGKRFFDQTNVYDKNMSMMFAKLAKKVEGYNVHKGNLLWATNSKPYMSHAEASMAKHITELGFSTSAFTNQGVADMQTLRHMDFEDTLKGMYLGIVSETALYENAAGLKEDFGEEILDLSDMEAYEKGINSMMDVFKEFANTPACQ